MKMLPPVNNCCGCNACAEICPKHCISMTADARGFLRPTVDTSLCTGCGTCLSVCPLRKGNAILNAPLKAYAAWNINTEEYIGSSSGGAAHVFSSYVLGQGGVVYGCTSEGMHIRHIRISQKKDLWKLQGSKYVQSDVRDTYSQVKSDLKAGLPVLFIGTPCQVAGLKSFMRHVPDHLYLIDLICHGVPSQQMLRQHIDKMAQGRTIERLSFRRGPLYCFELSGSASQGSSDKVKWEYVSKPHKDMYFRAFLEGISYRECCYACPFTGSKRVSDITIGDFWGLHNGGMPSEMPNEGISVVLPATTKGEQLIAATRTQMNLFERTVEEAVSGNAQLQHPVSRTLSQRIFSRLYPALPFDMAVRFSIIHCRAKTMFKICIGRITQWYRKATNV